MCSPSLVIVVLACAPHRPTRSPRRRQGRCYTTVQACGRRVCDEVRRPGFQRGGRGTRGSGHGRDAFALTPVAAVVAPIRDRSVHLNGGSLAVAAEEQHPRILPPGLVRFGVDTSRTEVAAPP